MQLKIKSLFDTNMLHGNSKKIKKRIGSVASNVLLKVTI